MRNYQEKAYGAVGTVDFYPPIEAQHVAVISILTDAPLTLAEVTIYGLFILKIISAILTVKKLCIFKE